MDLSQYIEDAILDWFAGSAFPTAPSVLYIDLLSLGGSSIIPTINVGSPNRRAVTLGATATDGTGRQKVNTNEVVFTSSADAGTTIEQIALYDAVTGGNQLTKSMLAPVVPVNPADPVKISVGNYSLKLD